MTTSLVLLSVPSSSFVALDLTSFTSTPRFRGIKNITPGIHFCYFSASGPSSSDDRITDLDLETSSCLNFRTGFFFEATDKTPLIVKRWDHKSEALVDVTQDEVEGVKKNIDEVTRQYLTPYENLQQPSAKAEVWAGLTACLADGQNLARILGEKWGCESSTEADWESEELDQAIRDGGGKVKEVEGEKVEGLGYVKVDLKRTWPVEAVGRERTAWARDRSWALNQIFQKLAMSDTNDESGTAVVEALNSTIVGQKAVLSELTVAYILAVLLANYSSTAHLKTLLELCLTSNETISTHPTFFNNLLATIQTILRATRLLLGESEDPASDDEDEGDKTGDIQEDPLLEEYISGGDQLLIRLLRQFNRNFEDLEGEQKEIGMQMKELGKTWKELSLWCRRGLGWYLDDGFVKKGMMRLPAEEGGGSVMVEIVGDEGEEYVPVVVDLGGPGEKDSEEEEDDDEYRPLIVEI